MFNYVIQSSLSLKYLKVAGESTAWLLELDEATQFETLLDAQSIAKQCLKSSDPVILSVKDTEIFEVYEIEFLNLKSHGEIKDK